MFQHKRYDNYSFEEIPLNRDIYIVDEIYLEEYDRMMMNFWAKNHLPLHSMGTVLLWAMIQSFFNKASENIFYGVNSKEARKACPKNLWRVASRKLDQLDSVTSLDELKIPPGNRLEPLSGDRKGQFSIRINEQYRICFAWNEKGPSNVEITDYH